MTAGTSRDLLAWLETAISEREEAARKAAAICGCHPPAPAWSFRDGDGPTDGRILVVDDPHPGVKRKISRRWNGSYEGLFMAQHVVLHDPESVLRCCAADRKLIEAYRKAIGPQSFHTNDPRINGHRDGLMSGLQLAVRTIAEAYGWTEGE